MNRNALISLASAAVIALSMGMTATPASAARIYFDVFIGPGWYNGHYYKNCGYKKKKVKVYNKKGKKYVYTTKNYRSCY